MDSLSLALFGQFQATINDQPVSAFRTRKVEALLIYLTVEPEPHRRESLMELLWPGMPDRSARHNLRQILYNLRQELPEMVAKMNNGEGVDETEKEKAGSSHDLGSVPLFLANRQTIQLNLHADVTADVHNFADLLRQVQVHGRQHVDLLTCHRCRQNLEQAVALYSDDFLSDFYLDDSNPFEDWAASRRQAFRRQMLDALETLTTIFGRQKAYAEARTYAERQLEIDELRESGYRQLMEILALSGQREEALAYYERCRRLLTEELGMAPTSRTTEIYDKIVAGDLRFDAPPEQGVRGYELKEEIGEGAYGAIYRAIQPTIGRDVAVKVIRPKYANDPEFIRRFEAEAQTVARLEHPYIVPLYDYWRDPQGAYLVMRLFRGGSLLASLEQGPWELEATVKMVDQIASALAAAHRHGVIHRDIKPANILFDQSGNAYLSDFGIAKDLRHDLQLTGDAAIVGTPDYASPEQLRNEPVTPQSDLYNLGAVLYETLTGERPFSGAPLALRIQKHLQEPLPLLRDSRPGLPAQLDDVIQQATAKRPSDRYADALAMAEAFRRAVRGDGVSSPSPEERAVPAAVEIYNPYKGLQAFQEADADDFYGRESMIQQLVNRMAESRFMAVIGPSGSGKSSLVKAGLIPALRQGALPDSEKWFLAEMTPGTHPLEELELALLPIAVNPPPSLLEPLQKDERGLLRTIRRVLPDEAGAELLLVIDQFEELFTLVEDDVRRRHFLDSLLAALQAHHSPLRVVVTLRADFYDRPLQFQPMAELFRQHTEIVAPLSQEELTWAIREPARRVGVGLEEGVVTAIVADVAGQAGTLPQVQYTLTELFDKRQDNVMTLAAYRALGGISGALGQRAEELYGQLDQAQQETTRQLFLRLVTLGEGVEDTRRRVSVAELEAVETEDSKTSEVLDAYGRYRLLTFDRDPLTREPTVEVAHEALLREWPRLRRWLEQSRDDVRLQRRLAAAANEWERADRDDGYLLHDSRLDLFAGWAVDLDLALTQAEQHFLAASIADRVEREAAEQARQQRELETAQQLAQTEKARAEEQGRSARRLRLFAAGLAVILLLAIGAAYVAVDRGQAARASADQAATSEAAAVLEASERATAEAGAVEAREQAEEQALLARSRELAAASVSRLATDPELSLLLAIEAMSVANTTQGENALHGAVLSSRVRQRFTASDAWLCGVTYSPDGSLLALTDEEGKASLWNVATGTRLFEVSTNSGLSSSPNVGFNGDASRLVTIDPTDALTVSFRDTASGQPLERRSLPATTAGMTKYSIHPELTQIVVGYENGSVAIWDLVKNELLGNLPGHTGWVEPFYSSNGRFLATAGSDDQSVLAWEAATATLLRRLNTEEPAITASISPDGRWLAVSVPGLAVKIWDLAAPNEGPNQPPSSILTGHSNLVFGLAFSSDSRLIATASRDGTARIWDIVTSEELLVLPHGVGACAIAFHPDGNSVVTGDSHGAARVWDIRPLGAAERLDWNAHDDAIRRIALSPGRDHLATIGGSIVKIWDPATGRELQLLKGHDARILSIAYHPDGKRLATAGEDGTTRVWDGETGQELLRLEGHGEGLVGDTFAGVLGVNFSPDGSRLATAGADGTARVWDADTGQELLLLKANASGLTNVVFSPNGRYLATSSDEPDATVRLWNAGTGEELFALPPSHGDRVWGLDFTPDGRFLATSGGDTTAKIWRLDYEAKRGELLATLTAHTDTVGNVRFAPDGQSLATAGENVRIWDVSALYGSSEGEGVPELLALSGGSGIAFNPERRELVTAGSDGVVRTYLLDSDELLALARSRLTRTWTAEECRQYRLEPCPSDM